MRPDGSPGGVVAWTSMRGIVSLASALALPLTLKDGTPWPYRNEILLITIGVILATLVVQGITLEPLIRRFRFTVDRTPEIEAHHARREALRHGQERLEDLADAPWVVAADVTMLLPIMDRLAAMLAREERTALADECFRVIPTLVRLDLLGYEDLFIH
jgi:CPA1 family monovalent cation:H+ antiporter